jgi:RNA polymerase sigma factor (sigma-70 family)
MSPLESSLLANLEVFVKFARNHLGEPHMAEDVVQESLVKALAAERQPKDEEETTAWFFRILRRSIIDVYRRQGARTRALDRLKEELPETPSEQDERVDRPTNPSDHSAKAVPRLLLAISCRDSSTDLPSGNGM